MSTYRLLINGELNFAQDDRCFNVKNPSNGELFAKISDASASDLEHAITSARMQFDSGQWKNFSLKQRGEYLQRIASLIRSNAAELAQLESQDVGKTIKHTTFIDVPTCADSFEYFSKISEKIFSRNEKIAAPVKSNIVREPVGVVGAVIPWNYPLIMTAWKIAPAIIAGNTIVLKPSSKACLAVMRLAELILEAGLPGGVVNIVPTTDYDAAALLINSSKVDKITFTGGTETGQKIMQMSAETVKKLTLELGGKSPNIVFEDCDQEVALGGSMSAVFMNQGQMCTAGSRLLLNEAIYEDFISALVEKTKCLNIGDASEYTTDFGPLVSASHRDFIIDYIRRAEAEGAKVLCGGKIPEGELLEKGYYIEPTILGNVTNDMNCAKEEAFGPVLCVIKVTDEQDAIRIANDSEYGLAASIWTKDKEKAKRVAKQLHCGTVWINTYGGFYNEAPFGGYKKSGFGRELGLEGLFEYTQCKHICIDDTPGGKPLVSGWF